MIPASVPPFQALGGWVTRLYVGGELGAEGALKLGDDLMSHVMGQVQEVRAKADGQSTGGSIVVAIYDGTTGALADTMNFEKK